jgi:hypothetical protein
MFIVATIQNQLSSSMIAYTVFDEKVIGLVRLIPEGMSNILSVELKADNSTFIDALAIEIERTFIEFSKSLLLP